MKKRTVKKVQRQARTLVRKTTTMVAGLTPAARRREREKRARRARTKALVMTTAKLAATEAVMMYREKRAAKLGKQAGKAQAEAEGA